MILLSSRRNRTFGILVIVALFAITHEACAFAPVSLSQRSGTSAVIRRDSRTRHVSQFHSSPNPDHLIHSLPRRPPSALTAVAPTIARTVSSVSPRALVIGIAAFALVKNLKRILWPGTRPDRAYSEPLPPGSLGCPLVGVPFFIGSKNYGAGYFYHKVSNILGNPRVWKYYFMGKPLVVVSGGQELKGVLNKEFEGVSTGGVELMSGGLMPMDCLLFETDRSQHSFLRRLIGSALTPAAVSTAVPTLQAAAEEQVDRITKSTGSSVRMEDVCTDYTLDVAWRQILGLDLDEDEIPVFQKAVADWISGTMSLRILFRIRVKSSAGYKAMMYVVSQIEEKIQQLERDGPDSSTLSGMLYATDEEDSSRRLSRQEVIDNALILIFAGSETSANTLTNAMLCLGLHPVSWEKLVEEQREMQAKHGSVLTKEDLDNECPYLEAVIKESMRLRAISGGIPRIATETLVVDGKQIPEGWLIDPSMLLTHELDPTTYKKDGSHIDPKRGFVPERWLSDGNTRPSTEFMPFGAGPRYCLGSNLALAEMKVFLAIMARNISFDLDKTDKVEWKTGMGVIARPADGVLVTARAKDNMVGV